MKVYVKEEAPDGSGEVLIPHTVSRYCEPCEKRELHSSEECRRSMIWDYQPTFSRVDEKVDFYTSPYGYTGPVIEISGPASYYVASLALHRSDLICIDAGGRNFGVSGSVYAKFTDIQDEVEKWRPGFWKQIEFAYAKFRMNPIDLKPLIWEKLGYQEHEDIPKEFKVLVCGQTEYAIGEPIQRFLSDLKALLGNSIRIVLIHGAAKGADTLAAIFGKRLFGENNVLAFPASWSQFGKPAGPIRNRQMAAQGPNLVAAFYVKGGPHFSKGTNDMVGVATEKQIPVLKYEHEVGWY